MGNTARYGELQMGLDPTGKALFAKVTAGGQSETITELKTSEIKIGKTSLLDENNEDIEIQMNTDQDDASVAAGFDIVLVDN